MNRESVVRPSWMSLRTRLWLVMLVVLLPGLAYIGLSAAFERQRARSQAQAELLSLARVAAGQEAQSLANMQRTLATIALLDPVQKVLQEKVSTVEPSSDSDAALCFTQMHQVAAMYPNTTGYIVWNPAGAPACPSSLPVQPPNAANESWFRQAAGSHAFGIGDFQLDPARNEPVITLAFPISNTAGVFLGVVSSGLDLAQLTQTASVVPLPSDAVLTIFNPDGLVLARSVNPATWDGTTLPNAAGLVSTLSNGANSAERSDVDGVTRLMAFAPITGPGGNLVYLSIGRPAGTVYGPADTALVVGLGLTAALTLLAVVLAALWGQQSLVRPTQSVLAAAERLAHGDLSARARPDPASSEIDRLGLAVNALAEGLGQRETQRQQAEQRQRGLETLLARSQAHATHLEAVAAGLSAANTPAQVLEVILRQGAGAIGAASATLLLLTDDGQWLRRVVHSGPPDPADLLFPQFPVSSPLPAADVVRTGEAMWVESAAAYRARYPQLMEVINATDYEAAVALPLRSAGRIVGVLVFSFPGELSPSGDLAAYAAALASLCALGLERAQLYQGTQKLPSV